MSTNEDIEAVVAELEELTYEHGHPLLRVVAPLILEAREERDAAIRRGNVLAEGHEKLSDDLIEARSGCEEALAAVVAELREVCHHADYDELWAIALIVLEARRERDEALALRGMGSELAAQSTSTLKEIARLTRERDAAREDANTWRRLLVTMTNDRDAAVQERDEALEKVTNLEVDLQAEEANVEDTVKLYEMTRSDRARIIEELVQTRAERDEARECGEGSFYGRLAAKATLERDAALAWVRELEADLEAATQDAMAQHDLLQKAEADLDAMGDEGLYGQQKARIAQLEERVRELAPYEHEVRAVHRYNSELAERIAELEAEASKADLCAVLETSCKNCASLFDKMHGLEAEGADLERESVAQAHVLKLTREQLEWRDEELARLRARIAELVAEADQRDEWMMTSDAYRQRDEALALLQAFRDVVGANEGNYAASTWLEEARAALEGK